MRWFYDPIYDYGRGLPFFPDEVHGFVLDKATRIRDGLIRSGKVQASAFSSPDPVPEAELGSVHHAAVVEGLRRASFIADAVEFPALRFLPSSLVRKAVFVPQLHAAGGTIAALAVASQGEWAINLSGGFHHARPDYAHGFCLLNDLGLAVARLRASGGKQKILILDLDLHQGDGNAAMFANDPTVFTVSMHEEGVFPFPKERSDLDVGLPLATGDKDYLERLEGLIAMATQRFQPDILVYVAGTDPYEGDPLGSLQLSVDGLLRRDRRVAQLATELSCALLTLPAGGYSPQSPLLSTAGFLAILEEEHRNTS